MPACTADEPPWDSVKSHVDESWFVDTNVDAALERVIQRQVRAAPAELQLLVPACGNVTCRFAIAMPGSHRLPEGRLG